MAVSGSGKRLSDEVLKQALARAVFLARRGVSPGANPQVGCVLLDSLGRIVAEGWHLGSGTPHAEIAALHMLHTEYLRDFKAEELTAVVTLEPCNHFGKTGPCTAALLEAGIGTVVYGAADPTAAGGGAQVLAAAGVDSYFLADPACQLLLSEWLRSQQVSELGNTAVTDSAADSTARPYVILKWAQTLDGRTAADDGTSQWVTGSAALADVHQRRAWASAIAAGTGTVLADNPSLTARNSDGSLLIPASKQPVPVIFGDRAIPKDFRVFKHPALAAHGLSKPLQYGKQHLAHSLTDLYKKGFKTLFVEGGATLISSFLAAGFADELLIYTAPQLLGGKRVALTDIGVSSLNEGLKFTAFEHISLGLDTLTRVLVTPDSTVTHAISDPPSQKFKQTRN